MTTSSIPTSGGARTIRLVPGSTVSNEKSRWRQVPFTMPREQRYYWTSKWQHAELSALDEMNAGAFIEFSGNDPADVARWLHEADDAEADD